MSDSEELLQEGDAASDPIQLADWRHRFTVRREYLASSLPYNCTVSVPFWLFMGKFMLERREKDAELPPEAVYTHGTMGFTYFYSVPEQYEFQVLQSFYEGVHLLQSEICLAPTISEKNLVPWFADIDVKQSRPIEIQYIKVLCETIAKTVSLFYPRLADEPARPDDRSSHVLYLQRNNDASARPKKYETYWDKQAFCWSGCGTGSSRLKFLFATSGLKQGTNKQTHQPEYGVGIHAHSIGRLLVTREQCQVMLAVLIAECEKALGSRRKSEGMNPWTEVFDAGVYKGLGGLRMLDSCKAKPCEHCTDKTILNLLSKSEEDDYLKKYETTFYTLQRDTNTGQNERKERTGMRDNPNRNSVCRNCKGRGKYLDRRSYWMTFILDRFGQEDKTMDWVLKDPFQGILATYIRVQVTRLGPQSSYWTVPDKYSWVPNELSPTEDTCLTGPILKGLGAAPKRFTAPQTLDREAKVNQKYPRDAKETLLVLNYARLEFDETLYGELEADYMTRVDRSKYRLAIAKSRNWKWCMTCNAQHNNRIFFDIDPERIYQKSGSNNTECLKGRRAESRRISEELREVLFGQTHPTRQHDPFSLAPSSGSALASGDYVNTIEELDKRYAGIKRCKEDIKREEMLAETLWYLQAKAKSRDGGQHRANNLQKEEDLWKLRLANAKPGTTVCPLFEADEEELLALDRSINIHDELADEVQDEDEEEHHLNRQDASADSSDAESSTRSSKRGAKSDRSSSSSSKKQKHH